MRILCSGVLRRAQESSGELRAASGPEQGLGGLSSALAGRQLPGGSSRQGLRGSSSVFPSSFSSFPLLCRQIIPLPNFLIHKTETKNVLVKGVTGPSEPARALMSCA